jgi:hypothetical protein
MQVEPLRGDCFDKAVEVWRILAKKGAKMMIGEGRSYAGDWIDFDEGRGMPVWHCWVENGDMVYDKSHGNSILMPKDVYYILKRVEKVIPYPMKKEKNAMVIPTPGVVPFVKEVLKKKYKLGFRDFTEHEWRLLQDVSN